jgi:membrane associated rhomboid family serine protease
LIDQKRFLELAALELVKREGVRVVEGPGVITQDQRFNIALPEWDEILVGEAPPALYVFANADGLDFATIKAKYDELVARVVSSFQPTRIPPSGLVVPLKLVAIFYFSRVDSTLARRVARLVPDRFYPNLRPEVWAVDLSRYRLYTPWHWHLWLSPAQAALRAALNEMARGISATPSDIEQAEESVRQQRALFIQTLRRNVPYVTYALLLVIWIIFGLEELYPGGSTNEHTLVHFGALQPVLIEQGEWWRFFTAMFIHVGFLHIFFNSIALYSVGSLVERIYGSIRYAVIYFVSGIVASVASYLYLIETGQSTEVAAGASGAIFGIAGVLIALGVLRRTVVPRNVAIQLSVSMLVLILVNIVFDAFTPDIDIRAHVGGLLVGAILGYLLAPSRPERPALRVDTGQWHVWHGRDR